MKIHNISRRCIHCLRTKEKSLSIFKNATTPVLQNNNDFHTSTHDDTKFGVSHHNVMKHRSQINPKNYFHKIYSKMNGKRNATKQRVDPRVSTFRWIKHLFNMEENHGEILHEFEASYDISHEIDLGASPVNILCIDGGGLKGYAYLAVMEVFLEHMEGKGIKNDFLQQFDLFAGTSVGGCASLLANQSRTTCSSEEATSSHFHRGEEVWQRFASKSNGIPTFVMTSIRIDDEENLYKYRCKPFILRTYDHPVCCDAEAGDSILVDGSSDIEFYKACAATSAVPGLVDEVTIKVDGKLMALADGMLYCNCPLVVALQEARYLYPKRPLGVVISIGFSSKQNEFAYRAIEIARLSNPGLHFQRICPDREMRRFSVGETDLEKIRQMQKDVKLFLRQDPRTSRLLDATVQRLFRDMKVRRE